MIWLLVKEKLVLHFHEVTQAVRQQYKWTKSRSIVFR